MRATIKVKLATTFTIVIALLCLVVGIGVIKMSALNDTISDIIEGPTRRIQYSLAADGDIGRAIRNEKNMMMTEFILPNYIKEFQYNYPKINNYQYNFIFKI